MIIIYNKRYINTLRFFNVTSYLLMILVNVLADTIPINGLTTSEVSDLYPNLFVPIGFTFLIWGVIYLALGLFVVYQTGIFTKTRDSSDYLYDIGLFFIISSIANASWIIVWHYKKIIISLIIMILLLVSLFIIYLRLNKGKQISTKEKLFVNTPFSLYLGWITVATITNITAFLVSRGLDGMGLASQIWTIGMIVLTCIITITVLKVKKDTIYSLVIVWSLFGILYKHLTVFDSKYPLIIGSCILAIVIIIIGIIKNKLDNKQTIFRCL